MSSARTRERKKEKVTLKPAGMTHRVRTKGEEKTGSLLIFKHSDWPRKMLELKIFCLWC